MAEPAEASRNLARQIERATEAVRELTEALKPRTEAEFWDWLRYNNPLMYVFQRGAPRRLAEKRARQAKERRDASRWLSTGRISASATSKA